MKNTATIIVILLLVGSVYAACTVRLENIQHLQCYFETNKYFYIEDETAIIKVTCPRELFGSEFRIDVFQGEVKDIPIYSVWESYPDRFCSKLESVKYYKSQWGRLKFWDYQIKTECVEWDGTGDLYYSFKVWYNGTLDVEFNYHKTITAFIQCDASKDVPNNRTDKYGNYNYTVEWLSREGVFPFSDLPLEDQLAFKRNRQRRLVDTTHK